MLSKGMGRGFERSAHPLGEPNGVMVPGVWQQARELLTPDTAKKIIRPQLRTSPTDRMR